MVSSKFDPEYDIFGPITADDIKKALELKGNEDVEAVYITSPTYEGSCSNYEEIGKLCKERNLIFCVDEAHGCVNYFGSQMPGGAIQRGADVAVTSVHKTLGGFSGTALINVGKDTRLSASLIKESYNMYVTTTPSSLFIADTESCVVTMYNEGEKILKNCIALAEVFKASMKPFSDRVTFADLESVDGSKVINDRTKVVIKVKGYTGEQLFDILD